MKKPIVLSLSISLVGLVAAGCNNGESADTSPLPQKDSQARVDAATKSVESSNMNTEQKQAAAAYLRQGAANAEQIKKSAGDIANPAPK